MKWDPTPALTLALNPTLTLTPTPTLTLTPTLTPTPTPDGAYLGIPEMQRLKNVLEMKLQEYNESNAMMDLVLFEQVRFGNWE